MFKYDFFKELSEEQQKRHDAHSSRVSIIITVVVVLAGILGSEATNFAHHEIHLTTAFICSSFICGVLISRIIFFLVKSYHGYEYATLPLPRSVESYFNDLEQYCKDNNKELSEVENLFKDSLTNRYVEIAQHNAKLHETKAEYFHKATESLVWLLFPSGITWIIYLANRLFW